MDSLPLPHGHGSELLWFNRTVIVRERQRNADKNASDPDYLPLPTRCSKSRLFSWQMYSIISPLSTLGWVVKFQGAV